MPAYKADSLIIQEVCRVRTRKWVFAVFLTLSRLIPFWIANFTLINNGLAQRCYEKAP